jgi:hypothetical protein
MDLRDRDHEIVQRVVVARHDRRHRLRDGDGGRDRIGGLVRHRAMAAHAVIWISNVSTAAMIGPGVVRICPSLQPRHVVDGIDAADAEAVHDALGAHHPAPPPLSSAGWKISATLPAKFRVSARYFAAPSKHRGVPVMAAGMHLARGGGGMCGPRRLHDRQRVHIGAQPDDRPLALPLDDRDDPAFAMPSWSSSTPNSLQPRGDESRRLVAVEGQFRMRVQMAAPALHLFGIGGDAVDHWHGFTPAKGWL